MRIRVPVVVDVRYDADGPRAGTFPFETLRTDPNVRHPMTLTAKLTGSLATGVVSVPSHPFDADISTLTPMDACNGAEPSVFIAVEGALDRDIVILMSNLRAGAYAAVIPSAYHRNPSSPRGATCPRPSPKTARRWRSWFWRTARVRWKAPRSGS